MYTKTEKQAMSENSVTKALIVPAESRSAAAPPRMDAQDWILLAV